MPVSPAVKTLIQSAQEHKASDLFLSEDAVPRVKIGGHIMILGDEKLTNEDLTSFWVHCGADPAYDGDRDTGFVSDEKVRFRVNLHRHTGQLGAVLRQINTEIPAMETLGLPADLLAHWVQIESGLVLMTGATGTGKSTSLAAMLEWVNLNMERHIVTIEDPIEYLFESKNSLFTQREVHTDTDSFARGLRSSLRQAPDVILLGEIRDAETATIALQAAETGHLVLSTLHSSDVAETVERLINLFPVDERESQLMLLSNQLIGILCQKLLPGTDEKLHLMAEHLEVGGAIRTYIREARVPEIIDFMKRGDNPNNVMFLDSLVAAAKAGIITTETAQASCVNPNDFNRAMRGVA